MMKQLFFVLFLATVVLMVSANEPKAEGDDTKTEESKAENGASMTTLTTASLIGLAFNVLMNFWQ